MDYNTLGYNPVPSENKGCRNKLWLVLAIIFGIIVIALSSLAAIFFAKKILNKSGSAAGDGSDDTVEYPGVYFIQDNELYLQKFGNDEAVFISDDPMDKKADADDIDYYSDSFQMTKDGKYILYGRDFSRPDFLAYYDLYAIRADGKGEETRISEDISYYRVLNGNRVVFLDKDLSLYISDLKDTEKIADDIAGASSFYLDDTQKFIAWLDREGNLYYRPMDLSEKKKKIDKDVRSVADFSDNFKTILYSKTEDSALSLYTVRDFEDKELIIEGASRYAGYVWDEKAYVYYAKPSEHGEYASSDYQEQTLYYYTDDTGEEEVESGSLKILDSLELGDLRPLQFYYSQERDTLSVAMGTKVYELDLNDYEAQLLTTFYQAEDVVGIYTIDPDLGTEAIYSRDFYTVDFSGDSPGEPELVMEDVDDGYGYYNGHYLAGTETGDMDMTSNLFDDGEMVAKNIRADFFNQRINTGEFVYYTDAYWEKGVPRGTLNVYKDGEITEIADDVYEYHIYSEKYIAILTDRDDEDRTGDLYLFDGKDCELIAEDVSAIVFTEDRFR